MPNASVYGGWYSFSNYGPVTTTFTPPPRCTATDRLGLGYVMRDYTHIQYSVSCSTASDWDCVPQGTTTSVTSYDESAWVGTAGYYSPGLDCPSGWATVGMAVRDDNSLSTSGFLTTSTEKIPYFEEPATLLASMLEPGQTMALCCPSSMTPNGLGECHTTVPDYKPTVGCYVHEDKEYSWGKVTRTNVDSTTTRTNTYQVGSVVSVSRETHTTTFESGGIGEELMGISNVPMVTIVHHQSDLPATRSTHGGSMATGSTATATTTSNVASKIHRLPVWNELAVFTGCVTAAMALGMAIMFQ
ncbi:hypothetical protein N7492_010297 [Penicillium capsulatum]|uniref:Uncharacterized protein n=1 Tax=Penicillium capsulatum TaxID=69766 RepID=A0A9W9LF47_9EURO|nr:hypothetical protein N7492_010297 [Penicillium capsulatum]KAJ6112803.1 hypothetical protein N7512_008127 [Penicillium capsulatum]